MVLLGWLGSGCSGLQSRMQLEKVANGWCETIRASQVIPVYPLTEDIVPGDIFLVQHPMALAAAVGLEPGEKVQWELLDCSKMHLIRLTESAPTAKSKVEKTKDDQS